VKGASAEYDSSDCLMFAYRGCAAAVGKEIDRDASPCQFDLRTVSRIWQAGAATETTQFEIGSTRLAVPPRGNGPSGLRHIPRLVCLEQACAIDGSMIHNIGVQIMMRSFILAAVLTSFLAASALAADATMKVDPAAVPAVATTSRATSMTLSPEDSLAWVSKPVYSLDGTNMGKVVDFQRGTDSGVTSMHADIGGFWGVGMTRVNLMTAQFKLQGDRVVLSLTAAEVKALPAI